MRAGLRCRIFEEGANPGQLTCCRGGAEAVRPALREKSAQVRSRKPEQIAGPNLLPAIASEEIDQAVRCRDIGADGMR